MRILIIIILVTYTASAQDGPTQKIQRLSLQKSQFEYKPPIDYAKRILRYDAKQAKLYIMIQSRGWRF